MYLTATVVSTGFCDPTMNTAVYYEDDQCNRVDALRTSMWGKLPRLYWREWTGYCDTADSEEYDAIYYIIHCDEHGFNQREFSD